MSALPILYSFRRCPYAMRARMACAISNTVCEIREVALSRKPAELVEASPKATVPVLVLPNGTVIEQSLDIMRWALSQADPEAWLAGDDAALIAINDGAFKHHLDRYKYPERYGLNPVVHRAKCVSLLRDLETRLARHANLCRDTRTLADMTIVPFIRQFAEVDRTWFDAQPLAALQCWLASHLASPLFESIMIRLAPWRAGDPVTRFPA